MLVHPNAAKAGGLLSQGLRILQREDQKQLVSGSDVPSATPDLAVGVSPEFLFFLQPRQLLLTVRLAELVSEQPADPDSIQ